MRLALTVVAPGAQRTADVVLEAEQATPVSRVAAELERFMGDDWAGPGLPSIDAGGRPEARGLQFPDPRLDGALAMASPDPGESFPIPLYVSGQRIPPRLTLLESPIRDGAVLG